MRNRSNPGRFGSFQRALSACSPAIADAVHTAHRVLTEHGVPHVLVGGIAVSAHASPRATTDVDFLVPFDTVWRDTGLMIIPGLPVPFRVGDVRVDYLTPDIVEGGVDIMRDALPNGCGTEIHVVDPVSLAVMKLAAGRRKDMADLEALVDAGLDVDAVDAVLADYDDTLDPALAERWASITQDWR